ncbi:hypothetical protein P9112_003902 [Eukaryota sp. TZLM1-RC]
MNHFSLCLLLALLLALVCGDPVYTLNIRNENSWYDFHYSTTKVSSGDLVWKGKGPGKIAADTTATYHFTSMSDYKTTATVTWVTHTMFGNPKEEIIMDIRIDERGYLVSFYCEIVDAKRERRSCKGYREHYEVNVFVDTS